MISRPKVGISAPERELGPHALFGRAFRRFVFHQALPNSIDLIFPIFVFPEDLQ